MDPVIDIGFHTLLLCCYIVLSTVVFNPKDGYTNLWNTLASFTCNFNKHTAAFFLSFTFVIIQVQQNLEIIDHRLYNKGTVKVLTLSRYFVFHVFIAARKVIDKHWKQNLLPDKQFFIYFLNEQTQLESLIEVKVVCGLPSGESGNYGNNHCALSGGEKILPPFKDLSVLRDGV